MWLPNTCNSKVLMISSKSLLFYSLNGIPWLLLRIASTPPKEGTRNDLYVLGFSSDLTDGWITVFLQHKPSNCLRSLESQCTAHCLFALWVFSEFAQLSTAHRWKLFCVVFSRLKSPLLKCLPVDARCLFCYCFLLQVTPSVTTGKSFFALQYLTSLLKSII